MTSINGFKGPQGIGSIIGNDPKQLVGLGIFGDNLVGLVNALVDGNLDVVLIDLLLGTSDPDLAGLLGRLLVLAGRDLGRGGVDSGAGAGVGLGVLRVDRDWIVGHGVCGGDGHEVGRGRVGHDGCLDDGDSGRGCFGRLGGDVGADVVFLAHDSDVALLRRISVSVLLRIVRGGVCYGLEMRKV